MATRAEQNCETLRDRFEGQHAIYVEGGVIGVRVANIRSRPVSRQITADIEEVAGHPLTGGAFHPPAEAPRRWRIIGGSLTQFSAHTWTMGYGGWSLFFAPRIVTGLGRLAADWAADLTAEERYNRAIHFLLDHRAHEKSERVFPDRSRRTPLG